MAVRLHYGIESDRAKDREKELSKMSDKEIRDIFEEYCDGETAFKDENTRKSMEFDIFWAEAYNGDFDCPNSPKCNGLLNYSHSSFGRRFYKCSKCGCVVGSKKKRLKSVLGFLRSLKKRFGWK